MFKILFRLDYVSFENSSAKILYLPITCNTKINTKKGINIVFSLAFRMQIVY